ncbi:MAG: shikimate kinase [candidate division Zixibacteria bacterium]|nr:shikimate kinase [candidate division Zixibacteria bacterium]
MNLTENIFLIGFSGSGKSTVGRALARKLGVKFFDTDDLIEKRLRQSVRLIFESKGEAAFRTAESEIISGLAKRPRPAVVALGGGAFQNPANRRRLDGRGPVIYLRCSQREIYRRVGHRTDRPLLNIRSRPHETRRRARQRVIRTILNKRRKNYERADIVVSTTQKKVRETVDEILRKVAGHICIL